MKVMIIGSGVSGLAVSDYLLSKNIECFFAKKEDVEASSFDENYINELLDEVGFVVISPGISLQNELIFQIKKKKIAFFSELEFGASKLKNDIIAVTGTNGKTTTVSLIFHMLRQFSGGSAVGGNIGIPVTSLINRLSGSEIVTLECSSFQLETVKNFKPHIAVILNITEDHLNRHKTMKEYVRCKYKITKNQTSSDYLILNADDEMIRKNPPKNKAKIVYFSTKKKVLGSYVKNGSIYFRDNEKEIKLVSLSKINLKGEHNLSNILAGVTAVYLETGNVDLLKNIESFQGVEHRLEYVKTVRGVAFFNDSKATNIASCLVAVSSFSEPINLILGGSDKGYNFDELFKKLPKIVENIAIFGQTRSKIAFSAKKYNYKNYFTCDNLEQATKLLFDKAKTGSVDLLSPACASFDFFANFEERGNFFKKIVEEIDLNENSCP